MGTNIGYIMTLANGIIGVSILAMPFCFKQCGIILSIVMLLVSSTLSRLACHFLLKSAIMARRRTFEFLAFHVFGTAGKFIVEIGIIGFLLGTCIAFFVVAGDLGPAIIINILNLEKPTETLRSTVIVSLAIFCVLPLGLLRNVDSLSSVCTATVGFYFCLVFKIILEALPHLLFADWITNVDFWRPAGVLQCLPIFSMALFCQPQLFEIYGILPNASLDTMNSVVRGAVNICTAVYIFVGVFGYIAFCTKSFTGNILMSFTPSLTTDIIKIGFVLSVAFSFPLVIFPCRASLHSLLFRKAQIPLDTTVSYIPEIRFRWLTILIVGISLIIGLLIPSIELVLGLVGSTIGVMICVLFPATCFICMTTKNTNERIVAQIMLSVGILVMVLGTYANLYAIEEATVVTNTLHPNSDPLKVAHVDPQSILRSESKHVDESKPIEDKIGQLLSIENGKLQDDKLKHKKTVISSEKNQSIVNQIANKIKIEQNQKFENILSNEMRQEPPQPVEPEDTHVQSKLKEKISVSSILKDLELPKKNDVLPEVMKSENKILKVKAEQSNDINPIKNVEIKKEEVDQEAIKKEDREIAEETKIDQSSINPAQELYEKLKAQGKEQEKVLQEAKQVLAEIKEQKEELARKQQMDVIEKKKAAMEIQKIANIAIESLSKNDDDQLLKHDKPNQKQDHKLIDLSKNDNDKLMNNEVTDKKLVKVQNLNLKQREDNIKEIIIANNSVINKKPSVSLSDILQIKSKTETANSKMLDSDQLLPIPLAKSSGVNIMDQKTAIKNQIIFENQNKSVKKSNDSVEMKKEMEKKQNENNELKLLNNLENNNNLNKVEVKNNQQQLSINEIQIANKPQQIKDTNANEIKQVKSDQIMDNVKEQGEAIPKRDILMENKVDANVGQRYKRNTFESEKTCVLCEDKISR